MKNVTYLLVSLVLVWVLLAGYLGYLHLKLLRLYEIININTDED